jgi:hypothetical protein
MSRELIERLRKARNFPTNTCPASRHAAMIAESLIRGKPYPMLAEEPQHCGESIGCTVASLYEARTKIERLKRAHDASLLEAAAEFAAENRRRDGEVEALRKDAERYRWLLAHAVQENDSGEKFISHLCSFEHFDDVNGSIDAAMSEGKA